MKPRAHTAMLFCRLTDTNVKIWKTRHKISVDVRICFYSVVSRLVVINRRAVPVLGWHSGDVGLSPCSVDLKSDYVIRGISRRHIHVDLSPRMSQSYTSRRCRSILKTINELSSNTYNLVLKAKKYYPSIFSSTEKIL